MTVNDTLEPLRKITKELEEIESTFNQGNYIRYNVNNTGDCFGVNILFTPDIAVQKAFLSKGTVFPEHMHKNEIEIMIVYKGMLKGKNPDVEQTLYPGDVIKSEKNTCHSWEALEDTWVIALTIPASSAYPHSLTGVM